MAWIGPLQEQKTLRNQYRFLAFVNARCGHQDQDTKYATTKQKDTPRLSYSFYLYLIDILKGVGHSVLS